MLTDKQCHRLAKEARKLADKFAVGLGPPLQNFTWCGCGIGCVMKAAGIFPDALTAMRLDDLVQVSWMTDATAHAESGHPEAMVFPLLALADALEEPRAGAFPDPQHPEGALDGPAIAARTAAAVQDRAARARREGRGP